MQQISINPDDRPVRSRKVSRQSKPKSRAKRKTASNKPSMRSSMMSGLQRVFSTLGNFQSLAKTKKTRIKSSSRQRKQRSLGRVALLGGLSLVIILPIASAGYYIIQNSLIEKSLDWLDDTQRNTIAALGLTIQEVGVSGRERTSSKSIFKALKIKRGDSILNFDPELARVRVEALGWVETASVMRRFPDEILIRITERRPFARWQLNGKTSVIDRNGAVVTRTDKTEFKYLPKIVGIGANEDAAELFDMLSKTPALFTRLHNAVRIRERRWNLQFDNGVTVLLPEEGSTEAWNGLNRMQVEKKILNKAVMAIDLRSKEKMYVRLKPDDAQFRRDAGNET